MLSLMHFIRTHWVVWGRSWRFHRRSPRPTCIPPCRARFAPACPCGWTCVCGVSSGGSSWERARRCTRCGDLPATQCNREGSRSDDTQQKNRKNHILVLPVWSDGKRLLLWHSGFCFFWLVLMSNNSIYWWFAAHFPIRKRYTLSKLSN